MQRITIDRKGIAGFLVITFSLTYAIESAMIAAGLRFTGGIAGFHAQLVIMTVMWIPASAAVITIKLITREGFARTGLHLGPLRSYLRPALAIPLCFIVIHGLIWFLGIGNPDWKLRGFLSMLAEAGGATEMPLPAGAMIAVLFAATTIVSPFFNGLVAFGEEYGWRGYLLPKLLPLGKAKAYLLMGMIWGLWHLPLLLVGFGYPGTGALPSVLLFLAFTTVFGIYVNEMSLRYRSSFLAAWLHGLFNSQRFGVWAVLFAGADPAIGGPFGLISIFVWLAFGIGILLAAPAQDKKAAALRGRQAQ